MKPSLTELFILFYFTWVCVHMCACRCPLFCHGLDFRSSWESSCKLPVHVAHQKNNDATWCVKASSYILYWSQCSCIEYPFCLLSERNISNQVNCWHSNSWEAPFIFHNWTVHICFLTLFFPVVMKILLMTLHIQEPSTFNTI